MRDAWTGKCGAAKNIKPGEAGLAGFRSIQLLLLFSLKTSVP